MRAILSVLLMLMSFSAQAQDVFAAPSDNPAPAADQGGSGVPVQPDQNAANSDASLFMLPYDDTPSKIGDPPGMDALVKEANKGSATAAASLGNMYMTGAFGEPDVAKAMYWLRTADQRGDVRAPFVLGQISENGTPPMTKNMREALKFYQRSADRGYPEAQYRIYRAYRDGEADYAQDIKKARYWLGQAAKTGRNPQVMLELADLVDSGKSGVLRDPEFAKQLRDAVRKSAAQ